jgi:DNA replication protein DnaC
LPRLLQQLAVARGDGSYARILDRLQRLELLAIDDWLLAPLRDPERRDLVEVIEDRSERASTLVASQLPATEWHASIGDPNLADAICDRVLALARKRGFLAGKGLELGGEVFGVSGLGRLFDDLVDDGEEVVKGPHGWQGRT